MMAEMILNMANGDDKSLAATESAKLLLRLLPVPLLPDADGDGPTSLDIDSRVLTVSIVSTASFVFSVSNFFISSMM